MISINTKICGICFCDFNILQMIKSTLNIYNKNINECNHYFCLNCFIQSKKYKSDIKCIGSKCLYEYDYIDIYKHINNKSIKSTILKIMYDNNISYEHEYVIYLNIYNKEIEELKKMNNIIWLFDIKKLSGKNYIIPSSDIGYDKIGFNLNLLPNIYETISDKIIKVVLNKYKYIIDNIIIQLNIKNNEYKIIKILCILIFNIVKFNKMSLYKFSQKYGIVKFLKIDRLCGTGEIKTIIIILKRIIYMYKKRYDGINNSIKYFNDSGIYRSNISVNDDYLRKCQNKDCNNYLNNNNICIICNTYTCNKCNKTCKEEDIDKHICNDSDIKSIKMIMSSSKQCPRCGEFINRSEGCSQMYCTLCHCVFDWNTGKNIKPKVYHNPHFIDMLDKTPEFSIEQYKKNMTVYEKIFDCVNNLSNIIMQIDSLNYKLKPTRRYIQDKIDINEYKQELLDSYKNKCYHGHIRKILINMTNQINNEKIKSSNIYYNINILKINIINIIKLTKCKVYISIKYNNTTLVSIKYNYKF